MSTTTPQASADKVSRNAMYVLFVMAGLLAFIIGMFAYLLLNLNFGMFTMEQFGIFVGVFTTAIATTGTLTATLIQQLWGS